MRGLTYISHHRLQVSMVWDIKHSIYTYIKMEDHMKMSYNDENMSWKVKVLIVQ